MSAPTAEPSSTALVLESLRLGFPQGSASLRMTSPHQVRSWVWSHSPWRSRDHISHMFQYRASSPLTSQHQTKPAQDHPAPPNRGYTPIMDFREQRLPLLSMRAPTMMYAS